jgi:putative ribosome biogenesis GTPase RsgA
VADWVSPGWLAAGHVHVFDGHPGVGKSMLIVVFCGRNHSPMNRF